MGTCWAVTVQGSSNVIIADNVINDVTVYGSNQTVFFKNGDPVGGYNSITPWTNAYPLLPWVFEYAYPDQCIQVRSLRSSFSPVPNFDPAPNVFTVANDTALSVPAKVVLSNVFGAVASITAQVTDPGQWQDSQFIEAMVDRLGLRFQEALNPEPNAVKMRANEDQRSEAMAVDNRG